MTPLDLAVVLLRVLLGVDWIAHALLKVERGMATHAALLARHGLPAWLAWPTFSIEIAGGLSLILGLYVRQWSMVLLGFLMVVIWFKWPVGWIYSNHGGGWEYPLFWFVVQLSLILLSGASRDASR